MRIAGTVILYNPPNNILNNIETYLDDLEFLLIYDNSSNNHAEKHFKNNSKFHYIWEGENKGIAVRLNNAIETCKDKNIDFLLTMDQDSSFQSGDFLKYRNFITNYDSSCIGMFGILHNKKNIPSSKISENQILITSGSVLNIKNTKNIGKFDDKLFIDHIDTDYCIRIFNEKLKTIRLNEIVLEHNEGEITHTRTLMFKKESRMIHSPIRIYFKTRNHLYLAKKHRKFSKYIGYNILLNIIKNNLLYNSNKISTLYYAIKGIIDSKKLIKSLKYNNKSNT